MSAAKRKSSLTGSRIDVKVERDGEVVRQMNAEINLPNVLATVFSTTRGDRGELPFAVGKDGQIYTAPRPTTPASRRSATSRSRRPGDGAAGRLDRRDDGRSVRIGTEARHRAAGRRFAGDLAPDRRAQRRARPALHRVALIGIVPLSAGSRAT